MTNTYTMISTFLVLSFLLAVPGCGWKTDGAERLSDRYDTDGDLDAEEEIEAIELEKVEGEGLVGRWAVRMVLHGTMAPLGSPWDITLNNLFIADISEDETEMTWTFCNQVVNIDAGDGGSGSTPLGTNEIPVALRDALANAPITFILPGDGTMPDQQMGWTWGLKDMDDIINDPLPSDDPNGPKIWDQDEDGHTGATVHVLNPEGDRYMIRRAVWDIAEAQLSDDETWITSTVVFQIDEHAFEGTTFGLDQVAPITATEVTHPIHYLRVPGEEAGENAFTCETLRNDYQGLFLNAPEVE